MGVQIRGIGNDWMAPFMAASNKVVGAGQATASGSEALGAGILRAGQSVGAGFTKKKEMAQQKAQFDASLAQSESHFQQSRADAAEERQALHDQHYGAMALGLIKSSQDRLNALAGLDATDPVIASGIAQAKGDLDKWTGVFNSTLLPRMLARQQGSAGAAAPGAASDVDQRMAAFRALPGNVASDKAAGFPNPNVLAPVAPGSAGAPPEKACKDGTCAVPTRSAKPVVAPTDTVAEDPAVAELKAIGAKRETLASRDKAISSRISAIASDKDLTDGEKKAAIDKLRRDQERIAGEHAALGTDYELKSKAVEAKMSRADALAKAQEAEIEKARVRVNELISMSGMDPAMKQRMTGVDLTNPQTRDAIYQLHGYYKEKKADEDRVAAKKTETAAQAAAAKERDAENVSAGVAYEQEFGRPADPRMTAADRRSAVAAHRVDDRGDAARAERAAAKAEKDALAAENKDLKREPKLVGRIEELRGYLANKRDKYPAGRDPDRDWSELRALEAEQDAMEKRKANGYGAKTDVADDYPGVGDREKWKTLTPEQKKAALKALGR